MQGSDAVFAGRSLNTPVYLVAIRAVAQTVGPVDHCDERRRAGLFLVRIGQMDNIALLGAGGERQHGREYQDNLLHYTEVMTKKIGHSFHCVGII